MNNLVDRELIAIKLQELERYVSQLKKHRGIITDSLENDLDKAWTIQHGLQISIQVVLDTGNHLLAAEGISVKEYAEIFPQLAQLQVIPKDYAASVKGMAGLRNILVHEYSELDMDIIVDVVNNHLDDFSLFANYVIRYIEKE